MGYSPRYRQRVGHDWRLPFKHDSECLLSKESSNNKCGQNVKKGNPSFTFGVRDVGCAALAERQRRRKIMWEEYTSKKDVASVPLPASFRAADPPLAPEGHCLPEYALLSGAQRLLSGQMRGHGCTPCHSRFTASPFSCLGRAELWPSGVLHAATFWSQRHELPLLFLSPPASGQICGFASCG